MDKKLGLHQPVQVGKRSYWRPNWVDTLLLDSFSVFHPGRCFAASEGGFVCQLGFCLSVCLFAASRSVWTPLPSFHPNQPLLRIFDHHLSSRHPAAAATTTTTTTAAATTTTTTVAVAAAAATTTAASLSGASAEP